MDTNVPRRRAANLLEILFVHNGIRMLKGQRLRRLGGLNRFARCGKHHAEARSHRENLCGKKKMDDGNTECLLAVGLDVELSVFALSFQFHAAECRKLFGIWVKSQLSQRMRHTMRPPRQLARRLTLKLYQMS